MDRHPIDARELVQVNSIIYEMPHTPPAARPAAVVVTHGMWDRASKEEQEWFLNLCNIFGLERRFESPTLGGAYFEYPNPCASETPRGQ